MELKIEYLPVGELRGYDRNARHHEDYDVEAIKKSMEVFGFNDPIGIWSADNVIVEGHGRLLAAKRLGMDKVPCIRLDHLTDEERRAYALAHNKTAELSSWDFGILDLELEDIDIDMSDFGFGNEGGNPLYQEMFEEFATSGKSNETEFATITFTFKKSEAKAVTAYIKNNGQESVVKAIMAKVGEENA